MGTPVLITGITGFIGSHLAERLLAEGMAVRGLARQPIATSWLEDKGASIVLGDLRDTSAIRRAIHGCSAVIHAAAWTGTPPLKEAEAWAINVTATGTLLDAAIAAGVQRFLYLSSVAVYGVNPSAWIDEDAATPPVGELYPDSKIAAEALIRQAQARGLATTIIRPASTYGPRGTAWTVNVVQQIKHGRLVLLGRDEGLVNLGYIENLVDGLWLALAQEAAIGETFNLCDGIAITYREFYQRYASMLGPQHLRTWPSWLARGAATPPGHLLRRLMGRGPVGPWSYHFRRNPSRFSMDRARNLLGYQPAVGLDEGMARTQAWLEEMGYLS
jgi:nucleoside-diphosphate-sugar epimerase